MAAIAVIGAALSGCSTWEHAMTGLGFGASDDGAMPVARAAPAPAPASDVQQLDAWCQQVVVQASQRTKENGFDGATRQRRALVSYRQCATLMGNAQEP